MSYNQRPTNTGNPPNRGPSGHPQANNPMNAPNRHPSAQGNFVANQLMGGNPAQVRFIAHYRPSESPNILYHCL